MSKVLLSRLFHIFQNILAKYSSLYVRLQIILKRLYEKSFSKVSIEGWATFEIVVTNRNGHKNVQ